MTRPVLGSLKNWDKFDIRRKGDRAIGLIKIIILISPLRPRVCNTASPPRASLYLMSSFYQPAASIPQPIYLSIYPYLSIYLSLILQPPASIIAPRPCEQSPLLAPSLPPPRTPILKKSTKKKQEIRQARQSTSDGRLTKTTS